MHVYVGNSSSVGIATCRMMHHDNAGSDIANLWLFSSFTQVLLFLAAVPRHLVSCIGREI